MKPRTLAMLVLLLGLPAGARAGHGPADASPAGVQQCHTDCQDRQTDCVDRCDGVIPCIRKCKETGAACAKRCVDKWVAPEHRPKPPPTALTSGDPAWP